MPAVAGHHVMTYTIALAEPESYHHEPHLVTSRVRTGDTKRRRSIGTV